MDRQVSQTSIQTSNGSQKPIDYEVHTFGCKVNTYDSGLLQKRLEESGMVGGGSSPQVHILNSCAVTAEATREVMRSARRLKRKQPGSFVVVTGCSAQVDKAELESIDEIDLIVGNSFKGEISKLIKEKLEGKVDSRVFHSNIFKKDDADYGGGKEKEHTRSFLMIQDGCNSFCTYCVIPYARGKSRSLSIDALVEKVHELESNDVKEVVLTGIHIGDYAHDFDNGSQGGLEDLIEHLLSRTAMERIRLTSLEPVELSERLLDLYSDRRMCPHFHMSIQSAQSDTLKRMKRKYTAEDVENSLLAIERRVPGAFVGMDVIVGFAGETDQDFNETYQRLETLPWTRAHVFPYSERSGTMAARLEDDVARVIKKERSKKLRTLSSERYRQSALSQVGQTKEVLPLKSKKQTRGLSRDYWDVQLIGEKNLSWERGEESKVIITGFDPSSDRIDGPLQGRLL